MFKRILLFVFFAEFLCAKGLYDVYTLPPQYSYLKNIQNVINNQKEQYTILYLFSSSVKPVSFANMLYSVHNYNRNHSAKLYAMQALIGMSPNLNSFLMNVKSIINGASTNEIKNSLISYVHIRISPEVFERLNAKGVPIVALAKCKPMVHPSKCKIIAVARGDIGVNMFLHKLKDKNLLPKDLPL